MINKLALQQLLKCPITGHDLRWLTQDELNNLNQRFEPVSPIVEALKSEQHDIFYPVIEDILYLLPDLALRQDCEVPSANGGVQLTKQEVKEFYDNFGWKASLGIYQDAKDSEDLRDVSRDYIKKCHLRLKKYLPSKGEYLLDVASGPIQYPAYLSYSEQYNYRICADISLRALQEAKKKLGDKGIYLLCDVTRLPLKNNKIDAVVSLHTLYHVPKDEQLLAFSELYRVLKPQGKSVVVYSWGRHSLLMRLFLLPQKLFSFIKRKLISKKGETLYFYAHPYQWFSSEIAAHYSTELFSWRSVNVPFLKTFVHGLLGGKNLLKVIFWLEERFPYYMGRFGAYPVFVSVKK